MSYFIGERSFLGMIVRIHDVRKSKNPNLHASVASKLKTAIWCESFLTPWWSFIKRLLELNILSGFVKKTL